MTRWRIACAAGLLALGVAGCGEPGGENPGPKRVFITGATAAPGFGGIAGADSRCRLSAEGAGLGTSWVAWMSDSTTNAIDRVGEGPWYRVDGTTRLFNNLASLQTRPTVAVLFNEFNEEIIQLPIGVWTGTQPNGTHGSSCSDWSSSDVNENATLGYGHAADEQWSDASMGAGGGQNCSATTPWHFYCFEL